MSPEIRLAREFGHKGLLYGTAPCGCQLRYQRFDVYFDKVAFRILSRCNTEPTELTVGLPKGSRLRRVVVVERCALTGQKQLPPDLVLLPRNFQLEVDPLHDLLPDL